MHTVASFHASAVQPEQLSEIMAAYLALERARIFRRLLVKRCCVLAVIFAGVSVLWLSVFAFWFSVAVCVAVPAWAWSVELGYERRLAMGLDAVPGQARHVVTPADETGS
jgi:hypothetical protein